MFFRGYTLRYAAVLFLLALFLLVTGLMVYLLWFSTPREPPRRSRPVWAEYEYLGSDRTREEVYSK